AMATSHSIALTSYNNILLFDATVSDFQNIVITNTTENLNGQVVLNEYFKKEQSGTFDIDLDEDMGYTTLEEFINNNSEDCFSNPSAFPFCDIVNVANYPENCDPDFSDSCSNTTLTEELVEIVDVIGEDSKKIEKDYPEEYDILPPPQNCNMHSIDFTTGGKADDFYFRHGWMIGENQNWDSSWETGVTYKRNYNAINENCTYAQKINKFLPEV